MHFDFHVLENLLIFVGAIFGIALELLFLHTIVWIKHWLELQSQAIAMRSYGEIVRSAVDYAEEWAHNESSTHKVFGEDKLQRALEYASQLRSDIPHLKLAIHAELGRRRSLRITATALSTPHTRPPLPPGRR